MWTAENREHYDRNGLRYPSDLTDEEFTLIEPFLLPERKVLRRALVNALKYVLTTSCQLRQLRTDFPARSTTHDYYVRLNCDGVLTKIHHALYAKVRELAGRDAAQHGPLSTAKALDCRTHIRLARAPSQAGIGLREP